ncbi:unnamed protein product, partial [Choristocarpus tenellus]
PEDLTVPALSTDANMHQLITADSDGICKLWDLRNFSCVQTF